MEITQPDFIEQVIIQFKQTSALEWVGVITAFACIVLAAMGHILNWPISIVSSGAYAVLYYKFKLYGDSFLQLYFLATAVYGWYYWLEREKRHEKPIVQLSVSGWFVAIAAIAILTALLSAFLDNYTNTDVPYIDGFCTAMSFVAQILMARKVLQNWILWVVVDVCYVPLLLYKGLASTAVLYAVLVILAVLGYVEWKRIWKQEAR